MPTTTHPEFNANTEGLEVAKAFADGVRGKTIIVTGVNLKGIGFSTAQAFASQSPARLVLTGRNPAKIGECIDALKAEYPDVDYRALMMDLSSQKSVRAAAAEVLAWPDVEAVDILVNSAAVMGVPERTLSDEGIELHFATNHIGHWLFTCLIMPKLVRAAEGRPKGSVRVVNVTSLSPTGAQMRWSDINFDKKNRDLPKAEQPNYAVLNAWGYTDVEDKSYVPLEGYNQSKVANVLFGIAANKRLLEKYGVLTLAVHPGIIKTELARQFPREIIDATKAMFDQGIYAFKTQGAGASTSLVASLDPKLAQDVGETKNGSENYGAYLIDCQVSDKATPLAVSSDEAEKLWRLSEGLVKQKFSW
ncbi:hypothetical protein DL764_010537 [Monosporascus ibericus]|uniref:Short-chain dehydrogenase n=1 Tax=Monosporascus ibericus TaxID=155417 RepID=A0A4V1X8N9_9PEZI|nr:hypothetical protein DL764_010537 [Monosporascus ibericus]